MQLTIAKNELLDQVETLYLEAFPAAERKPFSMLEEMQRQGLGEILAMTDDNEAFLGLAVVLRRGDLVLLDYLAVAPEGRSRGVGSETLRQLAARFAGSRLLIEIELPDEAAANNSQRLRRRQFYLRAGFAELDVRVSLAGVPMELLSLGGAVSWEEYHQLQVELIGRENVEKMLRLHQLP